MIPGNKILVSYKRMKEKSTKKDMYSHHMVVYTSDGKVVKEFPFEFDALDKSPTLAGKRIQFSTDANGHNNVLFIRTSFGIYLQNQDTYEFKLIMYSRS